MKNKIQKEKEEQENIKKRNKLFTINFIIWIFIFGVGLIRKTFQNDTFYTIKIGELILNNGIDMLDHFSIHSNLPYTYPHWLYDSFIYLVYKFSGFVGIYLSSIILFLILLLIVFKVSIKICKRYSVAAFATFICALAISSFSTARAQLVSFLLFALEIYFIEMFLRNKSIKYAFGLLLISLILCNVHVAVWPFYFILYLPYLAEFLISFICRKITIKKSNKFIGFLKKKFILEENKNILYLFIIMIASLITGLITPIGDTPYTYLIKTMLGNSQNYIQEHQMITWGDSPFTIIIAFETIFLTIFSKVKLRDIFMICGLVFMSIVSIRHLSLLALIGTICFSRIFSLFLNMLEIDIDKLVINFFNKKLVKIISFFLVIIFAIFMINMQTKKDFIDDELYPVEAVKYIKENIDITTMRLFNDYNFGSYLIYNDIPVFIDSRADLYTKQFSKLDYDIFDDYANIISSYQDKFNFYEITHVLIYKENNQLYQLLKVDDNYKKLYEDDYFVFYEKLNNYNVVISYGT